MQNSFCCGGSCGDSCSVSCGGSYGGSCGDICGASCGGSCDNHDKLTSIESFVIREDSEIDPHNIITDPNIKLVRDITQPDKPSTESDSNTEDRNNCPPTL